MKVVSWSADALDQLAVIWASARDRRAVNEAVSEVDRQLALDPATVGESRQGDFRIMFDDPLVVWFKVDPITDLASVVGVRPMWRSSR